MKMKTALIIAGLSFLSASCSSVRVNPKGCKTQAQWGSNPLSSREVTLDELEDAKKEIVTTKELTVFSSEDIRLRDLLEENGIKCEEVKILRLQIKTSWFFMREIQLKVIKI